MTEKTYKVPKGHGLGLHLPPGSQILGTPVPKEEEKKRFVGVDDDDELYNRRKQGIEVHFYEINPSDSVYHASREEVATLTTQQSIDEAVVAAFAAGSVEPLTARVSEWATQTYSSNGIDGLMANLRLQIQRAPFGMIQYEEDDQKVADQGSNRIRFKGDLKNEGAIRIGDNVFWRFFDTSYNPDFPGNFKITTEPSFSAARATLAFKGGVIKVYLKKLLRLFEVNLSTSFYVPYNFWSDNVALGVHNPSGDKLWCVGGQFNVREPYSSFHVPANHALSYTRFWQALTSSLPHFDTQIATDKAIWDMQVETYFADLQADSGPGGTGYKWFSLAYTWTDPQRLAVPRYYSDIPRGYITWNGLGGVRSSYWNYQAEFVGGIEYGGQKYYVWRDGLGATTGYVVSGYVALFEMSNAAWELEPRNVILDEDNNFLHRTMADHYVEDTTRDQFVFIGDPLNANLDFQPNPPPPKVWVDLDAVPLRFQE